MSATQSRSSGTRGLSHRPSLKFWYPQTSIGSTITRKSNMWIQTRKQTSDLTNVLLCRSGLGFYQNPRRKALSYNTRFIFQSSYSVSLLIFCYEKEVWLWARHGVCASLCFPASKIITWQSLMEPLIVKYDENPLRVSQDVTCVQQNRQTWGS
jgi:hypothetical protein